MIFLRKLVFVCLFVTIPTSFSNAEKSQAPEAWQKTMRSLAKTLLDGYPFFYSHREFRSKKNSGYINRTLNRFINSSHQLPKKIGKRYIGEAPLIEKAKNSFRDFSEVRKLYKNQKFDSAQSQFHQLIQNCFACHTAYQVGPRISGFKSEVFNIVSPFPRSKVVVMGALRQFSAALDWIEEEEKNKKAKIPVIDLVKLHLVISLRSLQDFSRAKKFLTRVVTRRKKDNKLSQLVTRWLNDLARWESKAPMGQKTEISDSSYVANLRESLRLHKLLSDKKISNKVLSQVYFDLGEIYSNLKLPEFSHLPQIYYSACVDSGAGKKLKNKCLNALKL